MAAFYSQLADLLRSGVPVLRSLEILERQSSVPVMGQVIREVRARVAEGTGLAEAMRHPKIFNELTVSMVRAGQEGGFLEDVLKRTPTSPRTRKTSKAEVVGVVAYPIFLAVVGFLVLNGLVIFFVPRFEPIFKKLEEQGELPAVTQVLMATSHFLQRQGWWVVVIAFVAAYLFRRWAATDRGRLLVDTWRLHTPAAGTIYLHLALSRFTRILGTLLHNGIPILQGQDCQGFNRQPGPFAGHQ